MTTSTILAVGLGGFLGAIARAYVVHLSNKTFVSDFPFGVLGVNILGSFLIGSLFAYFAVQSFSPTSKAFISTGFLGAFTTYSTFAIESFLLLETSFFLGILNILFNVTGSILAAASGYKIFHFFLK